MIVVLLLFMFAIAFANHLRQPLPRVRVRKKATTTATKEIRDLKVEFISLVGKAANKRTVVYKNASSGDGTPLERHVAIRKLDDEKRLVYGIVYPPDEADTEGHTMTAAEIEKAAHEFLQSGRTGQVDRDHDEDPDEGYVVESYIISKGDARFPTDPSGSWAVVIKVTADDTWKQVKKGELSGISMQGTCTLTDVQKSVFERFKTAIKSMRGDTIEPVGVSKDFNEKLFMKQITSAGWTLANSIDNIMFDSAITDKVAAVKEDVKQFLAYIDTVTNVTKSNTTMDPNQNTELEERLAKLEKSNTDLTGENTTLKAQIEELKKAAPARRSEEGDPAQAVGTKTRKSIGLLGL